MYNWYAVAGIYDAASLADTALRKNLAPDGFHVPTFTEWGILADYLGGGLVAGDKMKETGTTHWNSPNTGATNSSGFTGLPGGNRYTNGFVYIGNYGYWWSAFEYDTTYTWFSYLGIGVPYLGAAKSYKTSGFSVRCLTNQLGIQQQTISKIAVYPNPTSSTLTLQTPNNLSLDKITITDLTGKVVLTQTINATLVNVATLASGMYVIEAASGNEKWVSKFIKE